MAWPRLEYSKSKVKAAGKILREHATSVLTHSEDEVAWAEEVARNWRRAHAEAENWAQMGCRSRLATLNIDGNVSQRLKELPTVVAKLVREGERVQLTTMEDIAGARAVVPTLSDLRRLEAQWLRRPTYPILRRRDYIVDRPASGYRGVHLVFIHRDRRVEVQLRTRIQNAWADLVEELGHATGYALKNQEGPADVLQRLAALSDELAVFDESEAVYDRSRREAVLRIVNSVRSQVARSGRA